MTGAALVLTLEGGGKAELVETDGDRVSWFCSRAYPPGSPLRGEDPRGTGGYQVKVRGSRRTDERPDLPFFVEGRFINLTRSQRLALTETDASD